MPVYNEQENIVPFLARAVPILNKLGSYEILFVLDPSTDQTEDRIKECLVNKNIKKFI